MTFKSTKIWSSNTGHDFAWSKVFKLKNRHWIPDLNALKTEPQFVFKLLRSGIQYFIAFSLSVVVLSYIYQFFEIFKEIQIPFLDILFFSPCCLSKANNPNVFNWQLYQTKMQKIILSGLIWHAEATKWPGILHWNSLNCLKLKLWH